MIRQTKKDETALEVLEARVSSFEQALVANESLVKELDEEIATALENRESAKKLQARRREVEDDLKDTRNTLPALKRRIKENTDALCQVEAADRVVGVKRSYGSLVNELERDWVRALDAARAAAAAVAQVNSRFTTLSKLPVESAALAARFGVPQAKLATVVLPALRREAAEILGLLNVKFIDHFHVRVSMEKCEHGLRERRSFEEVAGTPASAIIERAGLVPFEPLNPKQQEIVAAKEREAEKERAFGERMASEIHARERMPARKFG